MKTAFILAITGSINSGKSTLARRLAQALDAVLLSSDEIRDALPAGKRRDGARVFDTMREALSGALAARRSVILDSTGMSYRFRELLRQYRSRLYHVHLRVERRERFAERESRRGDRTHGRVPLSAFLQSSEVRFAQPPDRIVVTDDVDPEDVYKVVRLMLY